MNLAYDNKLPDSKDTQITFSNADDTVKTPPTSKKTWCGYIFKDWTQIPLGIFGTGNVMGGIVSIVLAITYKASVIQNQNQTQTQAPTTNPNLAEAENKYGLYALAAVLFAEGIFLWGMFGYVAYLKPRRTLEEMIEFYKKQNNRFEERISELKEIILDLQNKVKEIEGALEKARENIHTLQNDFDGKVLDLEKVALELKASNDNLNTINNLYQTLKEQTKQVAENVHSIKETGKTMHQTSIKINEVVNKVEQNNEKMPVEIKDFGHENERLENENQNLQKMMKGLNEDLSTIGTRFNETKNALSMLEKEIEEMKSAGNKINNAQTNLHLDVENLDKLADKFIDMLDKEKNI